MATNEIVSGSVARPKAGGKNLGRDYWGFRTLCVVVAAAMAFSAHFVHGFELSQAEVSAISRQKYKFRRYEPKEACERFLEDICSMLAPKRCVELRSSDERIHFLQQIRDAQLARAGFNSLIEYLDSCAKQLATSDTTSTTAQEPASTSGEQVASTSTTLAPEVADNRTLEEPTSEYWRQALAECGTTINGLKDELKQTIESYESKLAASEEKIAQIMAEDDKIRAEANELRVENVRLFDRFLAASDKCSDLERTCAKARECLAEANGDKSAPASMSMYDLQVEALKRSETQARTRADKMAEKVQTLTRMYDTCTKQSDIFLRERNECKKELEQELKQQRQQPSNPNEVFINVKNKHKHPPHHFNQRGPYRVPISYVPSEFF